MDDDMVVVTVYFQPIANPQAGSQNRVENAEKDPATGKMTAISPNACTVQYTTNPIRTKAIRSDAGPPTASAWPEPINKPVPRKCQYCLDIT
jgi:hypothetical protein